MELTLYYLKGAGNQEHGSTIIEIRQAQNSSACENPDSSRTVSSKLEKAALGGLC
jgi:hypothetical protein